MYKPMAKGDKTLIRVAALQLGVYCRECNGSVTQIQKTHGAGVSKVPKPYLLYFDTNSISALSTSAGCEALKKCCPSLTVTSFASRELTNILISSSALATE